MRTNVATNNADVHIDALRLELVLLIQLVVDDFRQNHYDEFEALKPIMYDQHVYNADGDLDGQNADDTYGWLCNSGGVPSLFVDSNTNKSCF